MAVEPVYREFAPRLALRDFVHCVWTFEAPFDEAPQPIAPDGRCELIVQCGAPYREGDGTLQPRVLFAGQVTQPLTLFATGPVAVVGVRFRPEATRAFLGRRADTVKDQRVALSSLSDLAAGADLDAVAERAQDAVEVRVLKGAVDTSVAAAVADMMRGEASRPPDGLSERQWQRRWRRAISISRRWRGISGVSSGSHRGSGRRNALVWQRR